jgi:DNA-binding NtrC family response regulator
MSSNVGQAGLLRLLWVDDDAELTATLADYLSGDGIHVECAPDIEQATRRLAEAVYDLVLVDLDLPDGSGLSLIRNTPPGRAREFVVVTGHGSVKTAVEALHHQVLDYLLKPIELSELRNVLGRVRQARARGTSVRATAAVTPAEGGAASAPARAAPREDAGQQLLGQSPAMRQAQALVERAAGSEITVLVQGESGTGKEVVARCLHRLSRRAAGPFVALNCGAVSPTLIASELFGHERGSFTGAHRQHKGIFERADGGTLFLDEITEMPIDLQASLLRVLETGTVMRVGGAAEIPVNVRVVAATNRDPLSYVEQGKLRLDLYYRLQVFPIALPPLRERGDGDLLLLAEHFLKQFGAAAGNPARTLSAASKAALVRHPWPGNVRELRNVIERACLLGGAVIEPEHLMLPVMLPAVPPSGPAVVAGPAPTALPVAPAPVPAPAAAPAAAEAAPGTLRDAELEIIRQALAACGGNRSRTAAMLGISVKTLYNKLKRSEGGGAAKAGARAGTRSVLLLIHDDDVRQALAGLLSLRGFQAIQACDMRSFTQATRNLDIGTVIFDLHLLPGVSAPRLVADYQARRQHAGQPPARLIALTGSSDTPQQLAGPDAPLTMDRVIRKPVEYQDIIEALEQVMPAQA